MEINKENVQSWEQLLVWLTLSETETGMTWHAHH